MEIQVFRSSGLIVQVLGGMYTPPKHFSEPYPFRKQVEKK